jgi:hypothetical protein
MGTSKHGKQLSFDGNMRTYKKYKNRRIFPSITHSGSFSSPGEDPLKVHRKIKRQGVYITELCAK